MLESGAMAVCILGISVSERPDAKCCPIQMLKINSSDVKLTWRMIDESFDFIYRRASVFVIHRIDKFRREKRGMEM
jgi:hypothetical protein